MAVTKPPMITPPPATDLSVEWCFPNRRIFGASADSAETLWSSTLSVLWSWSSTPIWVLCSKGNGDCASDSCVIAWTWSTKICTSSRTIKQILLIVNKFEYLVQMQWKSTFGFVLWKSEYNHLLDSDGKHTNWRAFIYRWESLRGNGNGWLWSCVSELVDGNCVECSSSIK